MILIRSKKYILFAALIVFLIFPLLAQAAPILPQCAIDGTCKNLNSFFQVFINLAQWGLGILAVLATAIIFNSGFFLIFSAGNPEKINTAKSGMMGAIIGIIIILGSWVLINGYVTILTGNPNGTVFGTPWSQLPGGGVCVDQSDGAECSNNYVCVGEECSSITECDWWADHPGTYPNITPNHTCVDTTSQSCQAGTIVRGFCPGGTNIVCCRPG